MSALKKFLISSTSVLAQRADMRSALVTLDKAYRSRTRRKFRAGGGAVAAAAFSAQDDFAATNLILERALPMDQQTQSYAYAAGNNTAQGQQVSIALNNVGLQTSIVLEITGTIAQAAAETLTKTPWGLANIFSNITVTDFSNVQRVNTTSRHLHALACLRRQAIYGAAYTTDSPVAFGSNFVVMRQPSPVTTVQTFRWFIEIPLAYDPVRDLRGAIYAGVTNAQWRVQWTLNPNFVVPSTATDLLNAVYQSSTAGNVGNLAGVTVQIYQKYYDQLPTNGGQPILPLISLSYNYLLFATTQTGLTQGVDFPIQYPNFRMFLSTIAIYNNVGSMVFGTDVNYWGIQVANLLFTSKLDPYRISLDTRNLLGDDAPGGTYIFDHRRKPIITQVNGNTQLVLNASAVTAGATVETNLEMMAVQAQAFNAGSLPAG